MNGTELIYVNYSFDLCNLLRTGRLQIFLFKRENEGKKKVIQNTLLLVQTLKNVVQMHYKSITNVLLLYNFCTVFFDCIGIVWMIATCIVMHACS